MMWNSSGDCCQNQIYGNESILPYWLKVVGIKIDFVYAVFDID